MTCTYNVAGAHEPDRPCGRAPVVAYVMDRSGIAAELCERHARAAKAAAARLRATSARPIPRIVEVPAHV